MIITSIGSPISQSLLTSPKMFWLRRKNTVKTFPGLFPHLRTTSQNIISSFSPSGIVFNLSTKYVLAEEQKHLKLFGCLFSPYLRATSSNIIGKYFFLSDFAQSSKDWWQSWRTLQINVSTLNFDEIRNFQIFETNSLPGCALVKFAHILLADQSVA